MASSLRGSCVLLPAASFKGSWVLSLAVSLFSSPFLKDFLSKLHPPPSGSRSRLGSSQVPWAEERESTRAATKAEATFPRCKHVPIQEQKVWAKPLVKGVKNKKKHDLTQNSQLNWPPQGSFVGPTCAEKKNESALHSDSEKPHNFYVRPFCLTHLLKTWG